MDFTKLPDYPNLEQLARSLWREQPRGRAAVFVGAGFSRNADLETPDTPKPPLWFDLAKMLAKHLNKPKDDKTDALRVAEEYRAYFGRSALESELRAMVPDRPWLPSTLHTRLLSLPWADVLTTNYDTLLERAARQDVGHLYSDVLSEADLVHARSPRIVKLHGTVGIDKELVFTEEDFRQYPDRRAAFVNLARQVFIENELCLVGFSGVDPNFLQWSGWVRDRLAGGHRRIYLVGALGLSAPARQLLLERNVAPIDLTPLIPTHLSRDDRHKRAIELLLDFLQKERPKSASEWHVLRLSNPQAWQKSDGADAAGSELRKRIGQWQQDRMSYPGWLVCPPAERMNLRWASDNSGELLEGAWDVLKHAERLDAVSELVWRHEVAIWPLGNELLEKMQLLLEATGETALQNNDRVRLLLPLLRQARELASWSNFLELKGELEKLDLGTDERAELIYQDCLKARDLLEYRELEALMPKLEGDDAMWKIRKAGLQFELGLHEDAQSAIFGALQSLRLKERAQPRSIWARSRRAWASWFAGRLDQSSTTPHISKRQYADWEKDDASSRCDPWLYINSLKDKVSEEVHNYEQDRASRFVPQFQPGTYSDNSGRHRYYSHTSTTSLHEVNRLAEYAGLPVRAKDMMMLSMADDAVAVQFEDSVSWYLQLFRYAAAEDHRIGRIHLSRVAMARLSSETVAELISRLRGHLKYCVERRRAEAYAAKSSTYYGSNSIDSLLTWLARLAVRLDVAQARELMLEAIALEADPHVMRWSSVDPLKQLMASLASVLGADVDSEVVLQAIELPIRAAARAGDPGKSLPSPLRYIRPSEKIRDSEDGRWDRAIEKLLAAVQQDGFPRKDACARLATLDGCGLLNFAERIAFGGHVYSKLDSDGVPSATDLFPSVLAHLEVAPQFDATFKVRQQLWADPQRLGSPVGDLTSHLYALKFDHKEVEPDPEQAKRFVEALLVVERVTVSMHGFALHERTLDRSPEVGELLSALTPLLSADDRTSELGLRMLAMARQPGVVTALAGVVTFAQAHAELRMPLVDEIVSAMARQDWRAKASAAEAISRWMESPSLTQDAFQTSRLLDSLFMPFHSGIQPGLVDVLRQAVAIVSTGKLSADRLLSVERAVLALLPFTAYANIEFESPAATVASLVRAQLVKLVQVLLPHTQSDAAQAFNAYLEDCRTDPLPEVRAALSGDADRG